jgi:hypothetical protein
LRPSGKVTLNEGPLEVADCTRTVQMMTDPSLRSLSTNEGPAVISSKRSERRVGSPSDGSLGALAEQLPS